MVARLEEPPQPLCHHAEREASRCIPSTLTAISTRAIAHYREALARAEAADEPQRLFPCYDGLATAHLDLGDAGRAEEFMQKTQAVCERVWLEPGALVVLPFLD